MSDLRLAVGSFASTQPEAMVKPNASGGAPPQRIEQAIRTIRGERVMLDRDLAALYGVETRVLVQAVKRNADRFPADFLFQLTEAEFGRLTSQSVMSKGRGGRRHRPYAFTEQGVAMLSGVLKSARAVAVNVEIMRAYVRLRRLLLSNADLTHRLEVLERRYDGQFKVVFDAIRRLMEEPAEPARRRIGFRAEGCGAQGGS